MYADRAPFVIGAMIWQRNSMGCFGPDRLRASGCLELFDLRVFLSGRRVKEEDKRKIRIRDDRADPFGLFSFLF